VDRENGEGDVHKDISEGALWSFQKKNCSLSFHSFFNETIGITCLCSSHMSTVWHFFFLQYAGELHIIVLKRE
jgi:hypothetical protein